MYDEIEKRRLLERQILIDQFECSFGNDKPGEFSGQNSMGNEMGKMSTLDIIVFKKWKNVSGKIYGA